MLAESHDAVIELVYAVGDHVPGAGALLNLLADAVDHSFRQAQRAAALVPDRQGIGMSHRARADGH